MKKLIISISLSIFCVCVYSQDSMNKKVENKTDKMNKKMENPNDPMNKKIGNTPDTTHGKNRRQKSDSSIHKTVPKTPAKRVVAG